MGEVAPVNTVRVLVVEDDLPLSRSLRRALRGTQVAHVSVVDTLSKAIEALQARWTAFVVDVSLPDGSGLSLLRKIRAGHPVEPIIVMTGGDVRTSSQEALPYRAMVVAKPLPPRWPEALFGRAPDVDLSLEPRLGRLGLSRREAEVMAELARGATAIVAGLRLGISPATVRSHCQHVYVKLGAGSLTEVLAMANGWTG